MKYGELASIFDTSRVIVSLIPFGTARFTAGGSRNLLIHDRDLYTITTMAEDDDYFNDLSRQSMSQDATQSQSGNTGGNTSPTEDDGNPIPRPKRMACIVCRKRKLRCDGQKPSCGTCARVGHNCAYDEVRKKSGPKRGYVKQLEARLGMLP